ncbi:hypothetical protein [Methanoregula sp.]|uniref:hypothetical protein n=1 Tax=Methanoregula sp. TaxID=2052170 RepID=UPI0035628080
MPDQQTPQNQNSPGSTILYLELAVPALSFGGAFLALFFSGIGSTLDIRYFAMGCVISSFVLAYLAWIRPRKDIVALSTPIYSIIFFVAPSDIAVNLVLELLYATSLTILLVRLKHRFGAVHLSDAHKRNVLEDSLNGYCDSVNAQVSGLNPAIVHYAAAGFIRFAQGDYRDVVTVADVAIAEIVDAEYHPAISTAFAIMREQALLLDASADQPEHFIEFSETDISLLVKPLPPKDKSRERFEVMLENALLLLFAAAWNGSEKEHPLLLTGQSFAVKLCTL